MRYTLCSTLTNNKSLDCSKLKAFADETIYMTQNFFALEKVESIVGKGENAGYQI